MPCLAVRLADSGRRRARLERQLGFTLFQVLESGTRAMALRPRVDIGIHSSDNPRSELRSRPSCKGDRGEGLQAPDRSKGETVFSARL